MTIAGQGDRPHNADGAASRPRHTSRLAPDKDEQDMPDRRRNLPPRSRCNARLLGLFVASACFGAPALAAPICNPGSEPVRIEAGAFVMGSNQTYREEGPARTVHVSGFWIDPTEVTVSQFRTFVEDTGYVTLAEQALDPADYPNIDLETNPALADLFKPGGAVFTPDGAGTSRSLGWWTYVPGATWRHPQGPDAPAAGDQDPVTQIAFDDAAAYAAWKGGRLPTEAEWEYAALGGKAQAAFESAGQPDNANTWQGIFPIANTAGDGFEGVAPVGCFRPNGNGLYDMLGNVWEWTADWYAPVHDTGTDDPKGIPRSRSFDPANPGVPSKVLKGGSFLCADNYCRRYRPAARHPQETGLGTNHIGFRVVYDEAPADD